MNTQLLDTLKEKWTKKSTKIVCASVGTVAVLGVVGALVACNLPHTEQVIAEDGTITTVPTPQKESHGIFDLFHAPTEQADAAQAAATEITPPQTNADGTLINTPTAAPGTPQAAASGSVDNVTGTAGAVPAQASGDVAAPTPAPAAVESNPTSAAEQSAAAEDESPAAAPEQKNQWVKPVWVVDQAEVKAIPPKYNIIDYYLTSNGKVFSIGQEKELDNYQETNHVGMTMRQKKEVIDPGRPYSPEKGHWADPTTGKRLSPTYERSH